MLGLLILIEWREHEQKKQIILCHRHLRTLSFIIIFERGTFLAGQISFIMLDVSVYPTIMEGHSCKIGNMRCPGTLKNQNPQFEEKNKFFCFFMFLYPI